MLNEWHRMFMHDNRSEVEKYTENIAKAVTEMLDYIKAHEDAVSERIRPQVVDTLKSIQENNARLRYNLDAFEDAMMRGNKLQGTPDPTYSYTPDDYLRDNEEEE